MLRLPILGLALPALVAFAVLLIGWRPWRRGGWSGTWSGPIGFGAAFIGTYVAHTGVPSLPLPTRWQWIAPLVIAAIVGDLLLVATRRLGALANAGPIVALGLGATAAVMLRLPDHDDWTSRLVYGGAVAVIALTLDALAEKRGPVLAIALTVSWAALAVLLMRTFNARLAGIGAAMALATLLATPVALIDRTATPFRGGAFVLATVLVALAACGHAYDEGNVGAGPFSLLGLGLVLLLVVDHVAANRLGWRGAALRLAPVGATGALALLWSAAR